MLTNYPTYQSAGTIRDAAILTDAYVVSKTFGVADAEEQGINQDAVELVLDIDFTIGSLTDCYLKIEYSDNGTDWFQHTSLSTVAGIGTVSAFVARLAASIKGSLSIPMIKHPFLRVSAIGNGTVAGSLLAISARYTS